MPDLEKVIKGLSCCAKWMGGNDDDACNNCPYRHSPFNYYDNDCSAAVNNDAIALLKEQEPRILSWDEIKNYPVVYGEFKGVSDIYPLIITLDNSGQCLSWNPGINVTDEYFLLVSDEEDRKNTRCWNRMPTDEQRKAVKWE